MKTIFKIKGIHCASCKILLEQKLQSVDYITSSSVNIRKKQVMIISEIPEQKLLAKINDLFKNDSYDFVSGSSNQTQENKTGYKNFVISAGFSLLLIFIFYLFSKSGFSGLVTLNNRSSLGAFFVFGVIAGFSTCFALVGGIILSVSKNWLKAYGENDSLKNKLKPFFLFNFGRILSYALFGALLGILGEKLEFSLSAGSILTILVSLLMLFFGLQMLGFTNLISRFSLPKSLTGFFNEKNNSNAKNMPFIIGFGSFLLPCGFTLTAQSLALVSGNIIKGSLIMLFFALGTVIPLLMIGISSVKFLQSRQTSDFFSKTAGFLVLFFALYNINAQMNVLGFNRQENSGLLKDGKSISIESGTVAMESDKQIIKMSADSAGYKPNYFKVRKNIPVVWEITDIGTSGCTNSIIARSLFEGRINLVPGKTAVREFTPQKTGSYKFSCWMGMVSGTIDVTD